MKITNRSLSRTLKAKSKRKGRGISAGQGKTAGRGTKGQKSRAGFNIPIRFEGGQTALSMRLPKLKGFKRSKKENKVISLDEINKLYKDGEVVSPETLIKKGLITKYDKFKILANGKLDKKISFNNISISKKAKELFEDESVKDKLKDISKKPKKKIVDTLKK